MIWSVPKYWRSCPDTYALRAGDLVFTGTPAGVSRWLRDRIQAVSRGSARSQLSWFPSGNLTADQAILLSILSALLVLLVWGRWRYDIVALGALFTASLFGLVPRLSCSAALVSGNHHRGAGANRKLWPDQIRCGGLSDLLIEPASWHPILHISVLTFLAAILSMFMNNVGALALLMPVAIQSVPA